MWLGRRISFIVETAPEAFVLSLTTNDSLTPFSKDRLSLQIIHITMSTCHTLSICILFLSFSLSHHTIYCHLTFLLTISLQKHFLHCLTTSPFYLSFKRTHCHYLPSLSLHTFYFYFTFLLTLSLFLSLFVSFSILSLF